MDDLPEPVRETMKEIEIKRKDERYSPLFAASKESKAAAESFSELMMLTAIPEDKRRFIGELVHTQGLIVVGEEELHMSKVLFDSGAQTSSFISAELVEKHKGILGPLVQPANMLIQLGDHSTSKRVSQVINVHVSFVTRGCQEASGVIRCYVWSMPGMDMIVGMPDICAYFSTVFLDMLNLGIKALEPETVSNIMELQDLYRWGTCEEESPEEQETDLPSSFSGPLHYLLTTREEAVESYKALIDQHVMEEFRASTPIKDFLLSEKAIQCFVPEKWEGMKGFEPLELTFLPTLPAARKPKARPVNPALMEAAKKEFNRLLTYFYRPSTSPIASCLVIAPKATSPFIRFCGDYVEVNKYIVRYQAYIPNVQHSLQKAAGFELYLDIDLANSFHQIKLGDHTSSVLAVQTPWGLVEPCFLPEGVSPASGTLQSYMYQIFQDFEEWTIVIFDNILILAHDYEDGFRKFSTFIDRCYERGVVLKFAKTWLGFREVKFFGYRVTPGKYEMDDDRKAKLMAMEMPKGIKSMQRFLGAALFFKSFVPNFSSLAAPLYEMLKKPFSWDPGTWTVDYEGCFRQLKEALTRSVAIYFPNYEWVWILRVDASDVAVGAVLLQVPEGKDVEPGMQPLGFLSQKFSEQASRWDPFKKEAYAIYWGVKAFSYYLRGRQFILETDHRNLVWMEKSTVPIVVRWRVYLQSYDMLIRHISGAKNMVADWLSRLDVLSEVGAAEEKEEADPEVADPPGPPDPTLPPEAFDTLLQGDSLASIKPAEEPPPDGSPPEAYLKCVHSGRNLHPGVRRTWLALNARFPGHRIPYRKVAEFVENCAVCQKDRLGMTGTLEPIVRHLKPEHQRSRIGIDRVTVTPPDDRGNCNCIVVVEHFTKFCQVYPSPVYDAQSVASALFQYYCNFGTFEELISDPGADFMSDVVKQLNEWFGIHHKVSLVDRHESNGVEGTNKQLLRHLRTLVHDLRLVKRWSEPTVLCLIVFHLNDAINSETGVRPFDAKFGSEDGPYLRLPDSAVPSVVTDAFLRALDEDLRTVRDASHRFQADLIARRLADTPPERQNQYQPGDLVLFQLDPTKPRPTKLTPQFLGPYRVIGQVKNDVHCRHIVTEVVKVYHVERLKIYSGSEEDAYTAAMVDYDQYLVSHVNGYRGDPLLRSSLEFEVVFADGDVLWLPFRPDLSSNAAFQAFVQLRPQLFPLTYSARDATRVMTQFRRMPIQGIAPGDTAYVDLRQWGEAWYQTVSLPDPATTWYVVEVRFVKWLRQNRKEIQPKAVVFDEVLRGWDMYDMHVWAHYRELQEGMVLVTPQLVIAHPDLLNPKFRERVLRQLRGTI